MDRSRAVLSFVVIGFAVAGASWWLANSGPRSIASGRPINATPPPEHDVPSASPAATTRAAAEETPPTSAANAVAPTREELQGAEAPEVERDAFARIIGRFLLPDGGVATGVEVALHGWGANSEREAKFGLPARWEDATTRSGADGRFEFRFEPPGAFQFTVDAKLAGHARASWRWSEIEACATVDVGDVTLRRGGSIRGRMVGDQGAPLIGQNWQVYATGAPATAGGDETRVSVGVDAASAEFLLVDLPPGRVELTAHSKLANWIDGPSVEVVAGAVAMADVTYGGADLSRRITVTLFCRPFHIFAVGEVDAITLTDEVGRSRTARKIEGSSQSHCFDDVAPGRYVVEVEDRRMLPWSRADLAPGSEISAQLKGNAAVKLAVVDADSGASIDRYSLTVWFDDYHGSPDRFEILRASDPPPAEGWFDGLIPMNQTLLVRADGYAETVVELHPLEPTEVRAVTARLTRGATLRGAVTESDGTTPVAGLTVRRIVQRDSDDEPANPVRFNNDRDADTVEAITGTDGRFEFTGTSPGRYGLRCGRGPKLEAVLDGIEVTTEMSALEALDLALPPSGVVTGRLIGPPDAVFDGMRVRVVAVRDGLEVDPRERFADAESFGQARAVSDGAVRADGTYRTRPAPAGDARIVLQLPTIEIPLGAGGSLLHPGPSIELGTVEVPAHGEARFDCELRDLYPTTLRLQVLLEGVDATGAIVEVRRAGAAAEMANPDGLAGGALDREGHASLGRVPPGDVRVMVRDPRSTWVYWSNGSIRVPPGPPTEVVLRATLVAGEVTLLLGATRQPIAQAEVMIGPDEGTATRFELSSETGESGRVRLRLAPGRYRVLSFGTGDPRSAIIDWTTSGPSELEASLEPWEQ